MKPNVPVSMYVFLAEFAFMLSPATAETDREHAERAQHLPETYSEDFLEAAKLYFEAVDRDWKKKKIALDIHEITRYSVDYYFNYSSLLTRTL